MATSRSTTKINPLQGISGAISNPWDSIISTPIGYLPVKKGFMVEGVLLLS
jgi:hypothetical protein